MLNVLLIERDPLQSSELASTLGGCGFKVRSRSTLESISEYDPEPDIICLGECDGCTSALSETIRELRTRFKFASVILRLPARSETLLLAALRAGASDFVESREPASALSDSIRAVVSRRRTSLAPMKEGVARLVGESPSTAQLRAALPRLAASDCNVLITGETGTGKDLAAELIHYNSRRSRGPFVCINCAAFPDSLLESELFGHDRGAFTGASFARQGKLEYANCGTIFLDEIGEMTPFAQAKILRAIERREVQRLGSNSSIPVNVRIIAATNQDLTQMVAAKTFRSDLYFRLNVARLQIAPLRQRKQDISQLLKFYIYEASRKGGTQPPRVTEEALQILLKYDWPGNVRELKNLVEAIFISAPERQIDVADLPDWFGEGASVPTAAEPTVVQSDRELLLEVLHSTSWNKSKAAEKLNWSRMTLYRKLARYGLSPERSLAQPA